MAAHSSRHFCPQFFGRLPPLLATQWAKAHPSLGLPLERAARVAVVLPWSSCTLSCLAGAMCVCAYVLCVCCPPHPRPPSRPSPIHPSIILVPLSSRGLLITYFSHLFPSLSLPSSLLYRPCTLTVWWPKTCPAYFSSVSLLKKGTSLNYPSSHTLSSTPPNYTTTICAPSSDQEPPRHLSTRNFNPPRREILF